MAVSPKQDRAVKERLRAYQARQALNDRISDRRRRDTLLSALVGGLLVVLLAGLHVLYFTHGPGSPGASLTEANGVPKTSIAEDRSWLGTITVNEVPLGIELDGAAAPQAVSSFLYLNDLDFFTGLSCHRLTTAEDFRLLQCGDPNGDGSGGPDYRFGPIENAPEDQQYPAGTIAMARQQNNAASMGSQFFIVYDDTTIANDAVGGYTIMGRVTSGLDRLIGEVVSAGVVDEGTDGAPASPIELTAVSIPERVQ